MDYSLLPIGAQLFRTNGRLTIGQTIVMVLIEKWNDATGCIWFVGGLAYSYHTFVSVFLFTSQILQQSPVVFGYG